MAYKWCVVPQCYNTTIKTPEKMFVTIPKNIDTRQKWLMLARRDPNDIAPTTNAFMCEDHFNLEQDMANYRQYKMGFSQLILLVKGTMPSKFDCQLDHTKSMSDTAITRKTYITKDIKETQSTTYKLGCNTPKDDKDISETAMETIDPLCESCERITSPNAFVGVNKQTQVAFKVSHRSKAVQTKFNKKYVCHALHKKPTTSTVKPPDKTTESHSSSSLTKQSSDIIYMVYNYLLKEYEYLKGLNLSGLDVTSLGDTITRTADATGVSAETVTAILLIKELEEESHNEQVTLEHNYHLYKSKRPVSASSRQCISEKNKNNIKSNSVKSTKRKRRKVKRWTRKKQRSVRIESELDISATTLIEKCKNSSDTSDNEMTDSADESKLLNEIDMELARSKCIKEMISKPKSDNRQREHCREEDHSTEDKDVMQDDNTLNNEDIQDELVIKCEVFDDDINKFSCKRVTSDKTRSQIKVANKANRAHSAASGSHLVFEVSPMTSKEDEESSINDEEDFSIKDDDIQDNRSNHNEDMQEELVLKYEVVDDEINKSPSQSECLESDDSVVEIKVEPEDDCMEL